MLGRRLWAVVFIIIFHPLMKKMVLADISPKLIYTFNIFISIGVALGVIGVDCYINGETLTKNDWSIMLFLSFCFFLILSMMYYFAKKDEEW